MKLLLFCGDGIFMLLDLRLEIVDRNQGGQYRLVYDIDK